MAKRLIIVLAIIVGIILLCLAFIVTTRNPFATPATSLIDQPLLNGLKTTANESVYTDRLAEGLAPPTNAWFSGIALQKEPKTVFPTPLAFAPTDTGFSYSLTGVVANERSIIASNPRDVTFTVQDSVRYKVTRYDDLSVTLTYYNAAEAEIVSVTVAAGVPYVYLKRISPTARLSSDQPFTQEGASLQHKTPRATYAIAGATAEDKAVLLDEKATLYAAFSDNDLSTLTTYALNQVESTEAHYVKNGDSIATTFELKTDTKKETVLGLLPHQQDTDLESRMTMPTIYGDQDFKSGTSFSFTNPTIPVASHLPLDSITDEHAEELKKLLRRDINATKFVAPDTYFAGKELYRAAQLLELANQLDDTRSASSIQQKLRTQLELWLSTDTSRTQKIFTYDTKLKTIVGLQASFGSDEANDHHFHYGYFIYAASVLAKYDPEFGQNYGAMVDLLVADIANYSSDEQLLKQRSFDAYFGHSWASGVSPFNDGNNQESISEAINAWTATSLWATVRDNQALQQQSEWMLSQEVASMKQYWLAPATDVGDGSYTHAFTPLNWGGKRDYSTFFSDADGAKLGISLIPLSPTMQSDTVLNRGVINSQLEATKNKQSDVYNFEDYLLMYEALNDPNAAFSKVTTLPEDDIDGATSRSYIYAWVVSLLK